MSNARNIGDSAPVINFLDNVTSDIQTQLNTLDTAIGNVSVTSGSLTKTFAADETATVTLSGNVLAPVVTATKEVEQTGVTNNDWDAAAGSYTLENSATATTIDFGAYEVTNASYVTSFSVSSQTGSPTSLAFNPTGTSMYVLDDTGNDINQYNLSTAFDVSTASFYNNFSVGGQEGTPYGFAWNADGSKFFVVGSGSGAVHEYACSVAYNVTTASYTDYFSVSPQDSSPQGLAFNTDGTRMFVLGNTNNSVFEYQLTTGFDVSTASYTDSFSVASQETSCFGITFKPDGKSMYITGYSSGQIHVYTLTSAFDISTASYASQVFSTATWDTLPSSTQFNADGTKMFVLTYQLKQVLEFNIPSALALGTGSWSSSDVGKKLYLNGGSVVLTATSGAYTVVDTLSSLNQVASGDWTMYALVYDSTADVLKPAGVAGAGFDISVASYTGDTLAANILHGMCFGNNGTKMYTLQSNNSIGNINEYTLTTPYLPSSGTYVAGFSVRSQDDRPMGIAISPDGTKLWMVGHQTDDMFLYNLSTAWDVNTASYSSTSFDFSGITGIPTGITWKADGTKLYMCEQNYCYVYQYNASTAFDITTLSIASQMGPTTAYETQLEGVAISADGKKLFVTGGSSDKVHEYSLPTAFSLTSATYVQAFDVSGQTNVPTDVQFTPDGSDMYVTSSIQGIWQYSTQSVTIATGYQPAIASTIDSTYWTDINSMAATNAVGDGNVFYALSSDAKTSWNILSNGTGATFVVTVAGGKFVIDGVSQDSLTLQEGQTYIFDQADASNGTHPLRLSTTSGGGTEYTTGVTTAGTAGSSGAYTQIVVAVGAPTLYYYCSAHSGMGGTITIGVTGVRKIVKNNGGTYQVNTNSTYGSETWANAATNTEVAALRESMTSATQATGYQLASASYVQMYSTGGQIVQPSDAAFKSDGTKMYVLSVDPAGYVYQYSLSTAWDVSTASYDSVSFNAAANPAISANNYGIAFKPDGTKMYLTDGTNGRVHEFGLSTAWDISTASYTNYLTTSMTANHGLCFSPDGTKMLIATGIHHGVGAAYWTLSTAWDITTGTAVSYITGVSSAAGAGVTQVEYNDDGSKVYFLSNASGLVYQYSLTTAYDGQNYSNDSVTFNVSSQVTNYYGLVFGDSGTKMYVVDLDTSSDGIYQYNTSTISYINQMTSTELAAINDASQITLGTTLDLATILYYASGSTTPTYSGTAINYDANVINQGAILGTDYTYDAPAQNKVRITSVNAANLKIRVV